MLTSVLGSYFAVKQAPLFECLPFDTSSWEQLALGTNWRRQQQNAPNTKSARGEFIRKYERRRHSLERPEISS
jgi:hypothetical protein